MDFPVISNEHAKEMVLAMLGPERFKKFETLRDADFQQLSTMATGSVSTLTTREAPSLSLFV